MSARYKDVEIDIAKSSLRKGMHPDEIAEFLGKNKQGLKNKLRQMGFSWEAKPRKIAAPPSPNPTYSKRGSESEVKYVLGLNKNHTEYWQQALRFTGATCEEFRGQKVYMMNGKIINTLKIKELYDNHLKVAAEAQSYQSNGRSTSFSADQQ